MTGAGPSRLTPHSYAASSARGPDVSGRGWWPTVRDLAAMVGLAEAAEPASSREARSGAVDPADAPVSDSPTVIAARLSNLLK